MSQNSNTNGILTKALVINKTKCDNLNSVKNLNLWGNELEDLRIIREMPNLEVVSLSVNCISTLKQFSYCSKLQELYLRKNNIEDIKEIKYLLKLPQLKVLWLHDNPCANINNYREIVIKYLPKLTKLDNNPVTQEERNQAQSVSFNMDEVIDRGDRMERGERGDRDREIKEIRQLKQLREHKEQPKKPNAHNSSFLSEKRILTNRENKQHNTNSNNNSNAEKMQKGKHLLDAIFSLYKLLDETGLEIARNQCNRMLTKFKH